MECTPAPDPCSLTCSVCGLPCGTAHSCDICGGFNHIICGVPVGEEGFGQTSRCKTCQPDAGNLSGHHRRQQVILLRALLAQETEVLENIVEDQANIEVLQNMIGAGFNDVQTHIEMWAQDLRDHRAQLKNLQLCIHRVLVLRAC